MNAQHQQLMVALKTAGLKTIDANVIATQVLNGQLNQKSLDALCKAIAK